MKDQKTMFLNRIDSHLERDFDHRLTSKGDKEYGRFIIKHYKEMYIIFGGSNKFTKEEIEKIWIGIDRINKLLIDVGEKPESNIEIV